MFLSIHNQGIFAIVNHHSKYVYVGYSARLHQRLGIIQSEILEGTWKYKQMILDKDCLVFCLLDSSPDKLFVKYFMEQYQKEGYKLYNEDERLPLEYKFRIEILEGKRALVVAVNKRNDKIILGNFDRIMPAREFLKYISRNNPTKNLVFALK